VGKKRGRRQHGVKMETLGSLIIRNWKVVARKRCVWWKKVGFKVGRGARSEKNRSTTQEEQIQGQSVKGNKHNWDRDLEEVR
jgi:hypothetical protein